MASNSRLTKDWIQYLKNNQIVALKSDPNSGALSYRRPVTVEDLFRFLDSSSNFGEEKIMNAIGMVLTKKGIKNQPQKLQNQPAAPNQQDDVTDVDYKDVPDEPPGPTPGRISNVTDKETPQRREPDWWPAPAEQNDSKEKEPKLHTKLKTPGSAGQKPRFLYKGLKEDFQDQQGETLDERDVEEVFSSLLSQQTFDTDNDEAQPAAQPTGKKAAPGQPKQAEPADPVKQEESLRKIKRVIRDTMSPEQRQALWRALNENLAESQITNADVKEILKGAAELRSKPGVMGKMFKGLRKEQISITDLQQAWKDAGFPDDTRDIAAILKQEFGFGDKEIRKVFAQVFGEDDDEGPGYKEPVGSQAIQHIADYAKQNGIDAALKDFMKQEFSDELGLTQQNMFKRMFKKKAVAEEVRQVFAAMVKEERTERFGLMRQQEQTQLGRTRK